jgi:hypothetical protein
MKDVLATGEVFSLQKRTSCSSQHEISSLFSNFVGHFRPGTGSEFSRPKFVRIHPDLDPQHSLYSSTEPGIASLPGYGTFDFFGRPMALA